MLNEEKDKNESIVSEDKELDDAIDESLMGLPLDVAEQKLVNRIIEAPTKEILQRQFDLFNINQSKKNALRVIKLNSLLDKVEDQAIERFEKRPDQVSNKELLDYMNVVSGQIEKAQKSVDSLSTQPTIQINQQKNEVNINVGPELDRESKERVMDAVKALLSQVQKPKAKPDLDPKNEIIEESAEIIEENISDDSTVYLNNIDEENSGV